MLYYSSSANGFYDSDIHGSEIPDDAVTIDPEKHIEMISGQESGMIIKAGKKGQPTLAKAPVPTKEEIMSSALSIRETLMYQASLKIAPLQDAVDIGDATAVEEARLLDWKKYRIALNRIESQPGYPSKISWPDAPN